MGIFDIFLTMKWLLVGLALCCAIVNGQDSVPLLEGRYEDDLCHSVPLSTNLYQRRTIVYGAWSNEDQSGTWSYFVDVFSTSDCDPNFQNYRTTFSGTYSLTGKESEDLDMFWHIEYRYDSKQWMYSLLLLPTKLLKILLVPLMELFQ